MESVIVRDQNILGGRPVFRGTRVPIEVLFENLEDGLTLDEIVASYPGLNKAGLIACLEGSCAPPVIATPANAGGSNPGSARWIASSLRFSQ